MRLLRTREGSRGSPPSDFRASVPLRRVGPEEAGAERTRSIPWSQRTSLASNTRSALTTRRWCSIPLREEATPGPVASHCRNGSWGPPATALTPRARCGRSFVSTRVGGNSEARASPAPRSQARSVRRLDVNYRVDKLGELLEQLRAGCGNHPFGTTRT